MAICDNPVKILIIYHIYFDFSIDQVILKINSTSLTIYQ